MKTMSDAADAAEHIYRERFLMEKYHLSSDLVSSTSEGDVVDILEIVEAEIIDDPSPVESNRDDRP